MTVCLLPDGKLADGNLKMIDIGQIKELAQKATSGPWHVYTYTIDDVSFESGIQMGNDTFFISNDYVDPNNLAYMAAVNPNVATC